MVYYIYIYIYTHTHTHTNIMIYYIIVYTFAADLMVQQLNVLFSPQEPPEAAPTECGGSGAEGLRSIKASDFRMGQKLRASECFRMLQNASDYQLWFLQRNSAKPKVEQTATRT